MFVSENDKIFNRYVYDMLLEDAQSTKASVINNHVRNKVGHQVFKFKNKPENQEVIQNAKDEIQPIIDKLEKIILDNNPRDKNLNDLPDLYRLYTQLQNNPDRDNILSADYVSYLKIPSLVNKNTLRSAEKYTDWAAEIHDKESENTEVELSKKTGSTNDPNKVYEDDKIIVFLANNINDPRRSVSNCVNYGKGSSLCISGANARGHYHDYRWDSKLTTYFCWLKDKQRYMLVDAKEEGGFSYNPMFIMVNGKLQQKNSDKEATAQKIIAEYPETQGAFEKNVFKPIPIEGKELDFYERFYNADSILDFESLEDKNIYASLKDITVNEWNKLKNTKGFEEILKTAIETGDSDIPEEITKTNTSLEKRYWAKVTQRVKRELQEWSQDDEVDFTPHELKILLTMEEFPETFVKNNTGKMWFLSLIKDNPRYNKNINVTIDDWLSQYQHEIDKDGNVSIMEDIFIDDKNVMFPFKLQTCGDINAYLATSLSLPQLQTCGDINASSATSLSLPQLQTCGDINAGSATSLSLPQLQKSGYINAYLATSLSLPQLQKSGYINAYLDTSLSLPQLQTCGYINAGSATSLSLPQLQKSGYINAGSATSLSLPQLQTCGYINAYLATSLSLPQLQTSGNIYARSATSLSLPQLQTCGDINAYLATSLSLPQLQTCGDINASSAKKIIISSDLISKIEEKTDNVEIIEPSEKIKELNDSHIYNLMKSFLLRS